MNKLVQAWYQDHAWLNLLQPLSALFRRHAIKRRSAYQQGVKASWQAPVPVIVVGNITVGGVGKTPLVSWLAQTLMEQSFKPGIISRGYGSRAGSYPFAVNPNCSARESGDEPLMLARRTHCPVVIDPDRVAAAQYLLQRYDCNLIISDDGMQHYALARDIEIAVVDGQRGLGNGRCLPAGPLREPPERLDTVEFVVVNGDGYQASRDAYRMQLAPAELVNLMDKKYLPVAELAGEREVHAVAGIGNPDRFFTTLRSLGYRIKEHAFPDHHPFKPDDLAFNDELPVIMTEKDAVKCAAIANRRCWYLSVNAELPAEFRHRLIERIAAVPERGR